MLLKTVHLDVLNVKVMTGIKEHHTNTSPIKLSNVLYLAFSNFVLYVE